MKRKRKNQKHEAKSKSDIIAFRKSCPAKGTGLSHYILLDKSQPPSKR